jgi:hypothetical protein
MPNIKELPKQAFAAKLKKGKKIKWHRNHLMATNWRDVGEVCILSTVLDEVQSSGGNHQKTKSIAVVKQ